MANIKVEKVIRKENYLNQMWKDIKTMFGNDRHSYLIIRNYDIYDDTMFNHTEKGVYFWSEIPLQVYTDIDFAELLQCINSNILDIGICNNLPHKRQVPTYVRVVYEKKNYYIYQTQNSTDFKKLVDDRYCLSYDTKIQTEYGNKLAKFFGEIVEPITITK